MMKSKPVVYRRCTRCIADTTVPGISFDAAGTCSLCHFHDRLCRIYPENATARRRLSALLDRTRRRGRGRRHDCIIGISGGRDSTYLLYLAVREWGLRPLAVHFNDGFDNPVAGENMLRATRTLGVDLRTITSDFRECRDLKIVDLKASTPLLNSGTDVGIGAALYGVAFREGIKTILYGQSFRTEGIRPLAWAYFDGDLLRAQHRIFGTVPLRRWHPSDPGYNLGLKEMAFYILSGIRTLAPFYYHPYVRREAEEVLERELGWVYPGAHYYDDLYWSLITWIHRVKFNIDFRLVAYSALIRSGQMERAEALEAIGRPYVMEDEKVIGLCIRRLGLGREEFDDLIARPPRNFWDYPNSYAWLRTLKWPIRLLSRLGFVTSVVYEKYFNLPFR